MMGPKSPPPLVEPPQAPVHMYGVPGGTGAVDQDVHVLDRLHVIYKYRKAMISVALVVLLAGAVQTYTTTRTYIAQVTVQADPETSPIQAVQSQEQVVAASDPEYFIQTQLTALKSRDLKRKVVRKMRLDHDAEFMDPETPQGLDGVLTRVENAVLSPLRGWRAEPRPLTGGAVLPATATGVVEPDQVETPTERAAINRIEQGLVVDAQPTSHNFILRYSSPSPRLAALVPNELAAVYRDQNLDRKRQSVEDKLKLINDTLERTTKKLELDRQTLLSTPIGAEMLDPNTVQQAVAAARAERDRQTNARLLAEATAKELAALDPDKDLNAALAHPDLAPIAQQFVQSLNLLRANRADLMNKGAGPDLPIVKNVDSQIADVTTNLKTAIKQRIQQAQKTLEIAQKQEETAQKIYDDERGKQLTNARSGIPYDVARREIESQQTLQQEMLKQKNELEIYQKGISNNVTIVESAQPPQRPYKPNVSQNLLISFMVGIALALMLAFGLDYLDDTIKTPEDVTRKLHIPFLGLVPTIQTDRQPVLSGPVPHDFGEAYRALRTSLVFTSGGESTRIISCTSAQPLEGKTTTACNLAMVLAFGGARVLLIDADMRRPGVHKTLKMTNTVGLSHLLVGQARVREAIQRTSDPNFCVMTAGRTPPNPSELLASERMKQLIANLKQGPFDWVVIDTPPVLAVTDAVILTPLVDGVTFVLGAEMTRRRLAERAVHMLLASRPKVIGAVLNRVNFDRNKYYYSRYYGYQYKSYYGTGAPASEQPPA